MLDKLASEIDLMGRHLDVIRAVLAHEPIGILKLSECLHLPHHRVRYSLRVLEHNGYIHATPAGAAVTPRAHELLDDLDDRLDILAEQILSMKNKHT